MLAELASYVGDHDTASSHLERAVALIEPAPGSWAKAFVLSRAARLDLLRARLDEAIALGRQALEIAIALELDEIRVHALNTIGTARVERNELEGLEDVERSLTLARQINSPESARGYLNLSVLTAMSGDLSRSFAVQSEGLLEAERLGVDGWHRFLRGHSAQYAYWSGRGTTRSRMRRSSSRRPRPDRRITRRTRIATCVRSYASHAATSQARSTTPRSRSGAREK